MQNANRIGTALGLTLAAAYLVCSIFVIASPLGYMGMTAMIFHGFALNTAPPMMNFGTFVLGIFCIAIIGYLLGAAYATIFNALAPVTDPTVVPRPVVR